LELCNKIVDVAEHPEETQQYKELARRLQNSEIRVAELDRKAEELSEEVHQFISKPDSPRGPKSGLAERLDRIESILRNQINQQKKFIPQSRCDQSRSSNASVEPPSVSDTGSGSDSDDDHIRDEVSPKRKLNGAEIETTLRGLPHSKKFSSPTRKTPRKS
jgi:chromosome segregation ATPase